MAAGLIMVYATTAMPLYLSIPFVLIVTVIIGFTIEQVAYKPLRCGTEKCPVMISISVPHLLQNVALYVTGGLAKSIRPFRSLSGYGDHFQCYYKMGYRYYPVLTVPPL